MASVAARYGSVADVATYAGVSPRTVRRLIDAGAVRALKVRRRTLIPFQDVDDHILRIEQARRTTMPATLPRPAFDARGRAVALPDDEERARRDEALRALDELDALGDQAEQAATFAALAAALDEDRTSDRRRFPS